MEENIYHRYLNLPFEIAPPDFFSKDEKIVKHHVLDHLKYPQVDAFLGQFGLVNCRTEAFYTPAHGKVPIHTDHATYTHHAKINITWGPDEGVLQWWKSDIVEEKVINGGLDSTSAYHHNLWAEEQNCTLLHEANTNRPSLVNVGILHGTHNPAPKGRWTLCFTPWVEKQRCMLHWRNAVVLFKDYIVT